MSDPSRVLIVKTSSLGDIIHCFPVLDYLKSRGVSVDWVVERPFAEMVEAHPAVQRVHIMDSKRWRWEWTKRSTWQSIAAFRRQLREHAYDTVFDLQGNMKSGFVTAICRAAEKVGFARASVPEWPNMVATQCRYEVLPGNNIREDYLSVVQQHLCDDQAFSPSGGVRLRLSAEQQGLLLRQKDLVGGLSLMVCPGSCWRNKCLPRRTLCEFLRWVRFETGARLLVIWGSDSEREDAHRLVDGVGDGAVVVERLPLPALQGLMAQVDGVIAMDSLPLHLAATTGTPTFSIYGASSMMKYRPVGELHAGVQGGCPYNVVFGKRCPRLRTCKTGSCIRGLSVQELTQSFGRWALQFRVTC